ncbi:hypothetical protein DFH27DRAFT_488785, partial [Peziza echinospora]
PFNSRMERYPELIFVPGEISEIVAILREAKRQKKQVAARCGGHSYASYGLGGKDGAWVIDVQQFNKVDIDIDGKSAYIGAGNRLGRVALQLYDRARRAIPHGLCPRVGVAGHALHGGFGFSSRNWGLALDSIEALHVILPDGRRIWTSTEVEPELFFSLLGAGSSFGIVTEFKMKLYRAPEVCVHYWYTWGALGTIPSKENLKKIHTAFQTFVHQDIPKELAVRFRILRNYLEVTGAYWGDHAAFETAIAPLLKLWKDAGVAPDLATALIASYYPEVTPVFTPLPVPVPDDVESDDKGAVLATSSCIKDGIDSDKLFAYIKDTPTPVGYNWFLLMDTYGGKNSMIKNGNNKDHSCYSFRDNMFTFQYYINVDKSYVGKVPRDSWDVATKFLHGMRDAVMPNDHADFKAYMCYIDPSDRLKGDPVNPLPASYYYGTAQYELLKKYKERYDPDHVLWNPQSIGAEAAIQQHTTQ